MCLAMFSFAQTKSFGWLMVSIAILLKQGITFKNLSLIRNAYVRGKNAKFFLAENYDILLDEDLSTARKRLGL
jgi:ubiquinone biosynthesis protein Coq4